MSNVYMIPLSFYGREEFFQVTPGKKDNTIPDDVRDVFSDEMLELLFDTQNTEKYHHICKLSPDDERIGCLKCFQEAHFMRLDNGIAVLALLSENEVTEDTKKEITACLKKLKDDDDSDGNSGGSDGAWMLSEILKYCASNGKFMYSFDFVSDYDAAKPIVFYLSMTVLLQRAVIQKLLEDCRECSIRLSNELAAGAVTKESHDEVQKIYSAYVKARNALFLFKPVNPHSDKGAFLALQTEFSISEGLDELKEKIEGLYELSCVYVEQRQNSVLSAIAIIGLPLALIQPLSEICALMGASPAVSAVLSWGVAVAAFLVFLHRYSGIHRRK